MTGTTGPVHTMDSFLLSKLGTFSSAGLSNSSPNFTFQQSPKRTEPYVSGLGNPFLFALPKTTRVVHPIPESTTSAAQRKISPNAVIRARKRRAKEDFFGTGFRKRLTEIASEHEGESMSDSDNETFSQRLDSNPRKSSDSTPNNGGLQDFPTVHTEYWNASQRDYAYILSGYIQTGFNLFVVLVLIYLALQVIMTIQRDVQQKVTEYSGGTY